MAGSILLTGGFLFVVGMGLTIARRLEADGTRSIATVLRTASGVTGSVYLVTLPLIHTSLSYVVATEAPEHAKALFELSLVASNVLAWPLAIMFAATGLGLRRTARRSAIAHVSLLAAALVAMAPISVAHSGYFSPDVQQQVLVLSTIVWVATVGFAARRATEPQDDQHPTSASDAIDLTPYRDAGHAWSSP
jgi:hypothetical protein